MEFNRMAARLQESYAGLEHQVRERTRELASALSRLDELTRDLEAGHAPVLVLMDIRLPGMYGGEAAGGPGWGGGRAGQERALPGLGLECWRVAPPQDGHKGATTLGKG